MFRRGFPILEELGRSSPAFLRGSELIPEPAAKERRLAQEIDKKCHRRRILVGGKEGGYAA